MKAGIRTLGAWGDKENTLQLSAYLADKDVLVRHEAIKILVKEKDSRAAKPIAERLAEPFDRLAVSKALQELGSAAEREVWPHLKHADVQVRREACRILKVIGTKESVPALAEAEKDTSRLVARAAKEALDQIGRN